MFHTNVDINKKYISHIIIHVRYKEEEEKKQQQNKKRKLQAIWIISTPPAIDYTFCCYQNNFEVFEQTQWHAIVPIQVSVQLRPSHNIPTRPVLDFFKKHFKYKFAIIRMIHFGCLSDRLRMDKLELNVNAALDDASNERKRQLKLSFPADEMMVSPAVIKSPILPDRTRYFLAKWICHTYTHTKCERQKFTTFAINRERIRMQASGKLQISPGIQYDFTSDDLQDLGEIGRGAYGAVNKMIFRETNTTMAG